MSTMIARSSIANKMMGMMATEMIANKTMTMMAMATKMATTKAMKMVLTNPMIMMENFRSGRVRVQE